MPWRQVSCESRTRRPVYDLCDVIEKVCGPQSFRPAHAAKLAGRQTLPLHLMVCFGTGIMRHHMRMSTSGAGSPELFWSLLVWSVAVRASPPRSVSLRTGSNPDS